MAGLLRASEEGLRIVDTARRNLGWNKTGDAWCQAALTSKATLKRFWARQPIRRETFIDICKAVGIHNWEDIIECRDIQQTEPLLAAAMADLPASGEPAQSFPLPDKLPPAHMWTGRAQELATLKAHILGTHPRDNPTAICIVGLTGTGKTALANQLIRQLHTEKAPFAAAAWATLRSPTGKPLPFDTIADSLSLSLSSTDPPNPSQLPKVGAIESGSPPDNCLKKTENLLKLLKEKPCLVVFDGVETLLKTGQAGGAGYFAEDCSDYAWLFKQLAETEHQSKIIFTSRETLAELPKRETHTLTLTGLDAEAAVALLQSFHLTATPTELHELQARYRGHPKALELVAALIRDDSEYGGRVRIFLQDRDWLLTHDIESILDEVMEHLSDEEQTCLCRLSVYQTSEYPLTIAGIAAQMPEVSRYDLKENILLALKRRHLLEYDRERESYRLHPLVIEKAGHILSQNPEAFRTAHRQAYHYFITLPIKPESEWNDIEDIKPLLRAHYHASQAEDWPEAERTIAWMDECLRRWGYGKEKHSLSLLYHTSQVAGNLDFEVREMLGDLEE
ncbi:AAA family ATPase [Kamptonema formosum]|uniref:AAA family ATPase n=1 Tax=Kamptonema formosum TaxID=331992 RepID=UPI000345EFAC|nr:AAA family ATPase [Oscillatoria sp. PCC 10802]